MNRVVRAMRLGLEVLPMIEQAIRDAKATGSGWRGVRQALADQILRGDLDRALRSASKSARLIEDYVDGEGRGT